MRRLKEFAAQNHSDGPYDLNLGLSNVCSIIFHGIGGRTVDKMIRNDLNVTLNFLMLDNLLIFEFGTFQLLSYINSTSGTEHPVF